MFVCEVYQTILEEFQVSLKDFDLEKELKFQNAGIIRNIIEKPQQMSWKFENPGQQGGIDLHVKFWLKRGCFATSLLRELIY